MSTLDRYIARQYLFNVVALLVLLFSFVVVVDVTLNIDRMFRVAAAYSGNPDASGAERLGLVARLAADLWWPRLLQLFVFLLGMVLMAAMGFTISQIVRHRELVAMLASGISLRRVARPILIVATAMTILQIADQELVIPRIAPLLTRDHGDAGKHELKGFGVNLTADSSSRIFFAKGFEPGRAGGAAAGSRGDGGGRDVVEPSLTEVSVWERDEAARVVRIITAPKAVWRDNAWEFEAARIELLPPPGSTSTDAPAPTSVPKDAPIRISTDLDPTALMLRHYASFSHSLSWGQMSALLRSDLLDAGLRDKLQRIRFGRLSTIISNLLALIVVMPFFLTREPKNMVLQSLKCAPVGMITLLGSVLGSAVPVPGLPPALAAFLPVLVLAPIAAASLLSMKT